MTKVKKAKRRGVVTYVRLMPEEHARIKAIVEQRGWPHTFTSVIAETRLCPQNPSRSPLFRESNRFLGKRGSSPADFSGNAVRVVTQEN